MRKGSSIIRDWKTSRILKPATTFVEGEKYILVENDNHVYVGILVKQKNSFSLMETKKFSNLDDAIFKDDDKESNGEKKIILDKIKKIYEYPNKDDAVGNIFGSMKIGGRRKTRKRKKRRTRKRQ